VSAVQAGKMTTVVGAQPDAASSAIERDAPLVHALAFAYIALMAMAWPTLPLNMRIVDVIWLAFAVAVLWAARPWTWARHLTPLDWCVVALVVAPIPSLLVSSDARLSAAAFSKRVYVAALYAVFAVYFARHGVRRAMGWLAGAAAVTSAVCMAAALVYLVSGAYAPFIGYPMNLPYIGTVLRFMGGTESTAMLGNYLTVAWPVTCVFAAEHGFRGRWALAPAAIALAMAFAFSHALAGFAAATLVIAWPLATTPTTRTIRTVAAVAAVALIVAMNLALVVTVRDVKVARDHNRDVAPPDYAYGFQRPEGADRITVALSYNPMSYFLIKQVALRAFEEHPLTGIGLGAFHHETARANDEGLLHDHYRAIDPHMTLFGALAETGVAGGLAVVALFVVALGAAPRTADVWMRRALQAGIVGIAINSINVDALNFRFLWVGLAALRALDAPIGVRSATRRAAR
jgi:O-antigen ligase/polysaccharide polymerase Wzy-like membrane protein